MLTPFIVIIIMKELRREEVERELFEEQSTPTFTLRRLSHSANSLLKVPNVELFLQPNTTPHSRSSVLSFNNDHNPYTPAFVDGSEKEDFCVSDCGYKIIYEKEIAKKEDQRPRTAEQKNKKKTIFKPEPRSTFCSVCHESFTNYFTHISHPIHLKFIAESKATGFIQDLVVFVRGKSWRREVRLREEGKARGRSADPTIGTGETLSQTSTEKELVARVSSVQFQQAQNEDLRHNTYK